MIDAYHLKYQGFQEKQSNGAYTERTYRRDIMGTGKCRERDSNRGYPFSSVKKAVKMNRKRNLVLVINHDI